MICYYFDAPTYFLFASDLPELLYYSHIPVMAVALIVGFFVFFNGRNVLLNKLLLLISLCFALWTFFNLITWTNIDTTLILFVWSLMGPLQAILSILCIYFIHVFLTKKDLPKKIKALLLVLISPVLIFAPTNLALQGFDITWCDAFSYENQTFVLYYTALGLLAMIWIGVMLVKYYRVATGQARRQILFMGVGIELFLLFFFALVYLAGLLTNIGVFQDSRWEMYGLFGMAIFMTIMGFMIVRFKTFAIATQASQVLVVALLVLVASQFTFVTTTTSTILTSVTLLLTSFAGLIIVRSVKKEVRQREEIEELAVSLKKANKRLKELDQRKSEFVSIASHQLRSPLTSIRGYASMLLECSYGKLSKKATEAVSRIADSSTHMTSSIEDYLNVSRIEAGNMKYELSDFNLKVETEHVADDKRKEAIKEGLLVTFKSNLTKQGIVNADIGKTRQIIHNLVNNSIKYTPRGTITIYVHDDTKKKKVYVDIIDSGIGIQSDEIDDIFGKFERAHNANQTNVTGTGLGLFVARKMARKMNGDVTAESKGVGHGSTFRLEMPLVK